MTKTQLVYLASPYSHPDERVRQARYEAACMYTAQLLRAGELVVSPIVHSHPLVAHGAGGDWSSWQALDLELLSRADVLLVLMLPGWEDSRGVQTEIGFAMGRGIPIEYLGVRKAIAAGV